MRERRMDNGMLKVELNTGADSQHLTCTIASRTKNLFRKPRTMRISRHNSQDWFEIHSIICSLSAAMAISLVDDIRDRSSKL